MDQTHAIGERVYRQLKSDVLRGALELNVRIDFAALAVDYGVSTTPIREAAMRLMGERLLELHPRGGARQFLMTAATLRGLFELHRRLVALALGWSEATIELGDPSTDASTDEQRARRLFAAVVRSTENEEFAAVMDNLADRLAPTRTLEHHVFPDFAAELGALEEMVNDRATLARNLRRYHARRKSAVSSLVWLAAADQRQHEL